MKKERKAREARVGLFLFSRKKTLGKKKIQKNSPRGRGKSATISLRSHGCPGDDRPD